MTKIQNFKFTLLVIITLFSFEYGFSCSMYKITLDGKTMVGCNYDAYYLTAKIWFESGINKNSYGAAFVGARSEGNNGILPQSGMNDEGLAFSRLAAPTPAKNLLETSSIKVITDHVKYLKDVLHKCKTIEEVISYIAQNGFGFFSDEVCIYIEKSGRYLIVEPDTLTTGNDAKYVLSNFCPSSTDYSTIKQIRYLNGVEFLKNKIDTSIVFCTALSDTMHVCRKKMGDGTLVTLIRDLNEGLIYLYFYHDYQHQLKFKLKDELAKGDHVLEIPKLFPPNAEYEKLATFKTPQNSTGLNYFMRFCVILFSFTSLYFLISYFRKRKTANHSNVKLILFTLGLILIYYVFVLIRNENIFYFPAPYKDYKFTMLNVAAYIPFMLLLLIIPLITVNLRIFKEHGWLNFSKWLFAINNLVYTILLGLYTYWGLFNMFD